MTRETKTFLSNHLYIQIHFWVPEKFTCSLCINSRMVFSHLTAYAFFFLLKVSLHVKKQQMFSITVSTFNLLWHYNWPLNREFRNILYGGSFIFRSHSYFLFLFSFFLIQKVCDCSFDGYQFHDLDSLLESLGLLSQNKSVIRSPILSVSKGQSTATHLRGLLEEG